MPRSLTLVLRGIEPRRICNLTITDIALRHADKLSPHVTKPLQNSSCRTRSSEARMPTGGVVNSKGWSGENVRGSNDSCVSAAKQLDQQPLKSRTHPIWPHTCPRVSKSRSLTALTIDAGAAAKCTLREL